MKRNLKTPMYNANNPNTVEIKEQNNKHNN